MRPWDEELAGFRFEITSEIGLDRCRRGRGSPADPPATSRRARLRPTRGPHPFYWDENDFIGRGVVDTENATDWNTRRGWVMAPGGYCQNTADGSRPMDEDRVANGRPGDGVEAPRAWRRRASRLERRRPSASARASRTPTEERTAPHSTTPS